MRNRTLISPFALAIAAALTATAGAATINVPGDHPTIQAAVNAAAPGDEIVVQPGTYIENIDVNKSVLVRSINPTNALVVAATIIDGNGVSRTAVIRQSAELSGFTIIGGNATLPFPGNEGGGVLILDQATLSHCVISGNFAVFGGGVFSKNNSGAGSTIRDCTIVGNTSSNQGGGLFTDGGSQTVKNCHFIANIANPANNEQGGGGIACRSTLLVENSTFTAHQQHAFVTFGNGTPIATIDKCMFVANSPAAIHHFNAAQDLTVRNSSLCNNSPNDLIGNPIIDGGGNNLSGCTFIETITEDDCCGALPITLGDTQFSTIGATGLVELDASCNKGPGGLLGGDIWYRYVPTRSGTLTVSTCNQVDYDSRLAAYTGGCEGLSLIACNDDGVGCSGFSSLMIVSVVEGEEVLLQVGGYGLGSNFLTGSGTLTLSLEFCSSDLTNDGVVNFSDLLEILKNWGPCGNGW